MLDIVTAFNLIHFVQSESLADLLPWGNNPSYRIGHHQRLYSAQETVDISSVMPTLGDIPWTLENSENLQ